MQTTFHILVIEDDPDGRRSVADALEAAGHRVTAAAGGAAGLAELDRHRFDLVLSDVRLPDLSGMEVLERIRRRLPELPVLLMTAYGTVATAVAALQAGAYDYILKPLDLADLQAKVARAGETVRLRAEVGRLQAALSERQGRARWSLLPTGCGRCSTGCGRWLPPARRF